jgi:hypothetical protein
MNRNKPGLVSLLAFLTLFLTACEREEEAGNMINIQDFATRYAASWSSQDPVGHSMFYAEEGTLRINDGEPSVGRAAVEKTARSFMTSFPDMDIRLVEVREAGGKVQFHWHWTGTNTGPGGTGAAVDLKGYEEWTLSNDGLILYSQGHMDDEEYQRQLAAGPAAQD